MNAEEKARESDATRRYARTILAREIKRNPRQPLTQAQIDRAAIVGEIARRRVAARSKLGPSEALHQASALPNARVRQDRFEQGLEAAVIEAIKPRF